MCRTLDYSFTLSRAHFCYCGVSIVYYYWPISYVISAESTKVIDCELVYVWKFYFL